MSSVTSNDSIPDGNCVKMMQFMTQHPTQSRDPTKASLAIVHDGANIQRVALLVRNTDKWYRIIERIATASPEVLDINECDPDMASKYNTLTETMNEFFYQAFNILDRDWVNYQSICQDPTKFNIQGSSFNLHKY